jgi:formylglycine-generating enzyme required for sulfatase activity
MAKLIIERSTYTNRRFFEKLKDDISLEMVLIPSGSFEMGAAENELESNQDELPQHLVTVPTFFMGRYLVTWWGDKDG